jgi:hypothetical protein
MRRFFNLDKMKGPIREGRALLSRLWAGKGFRFA